MFFYNWYLLGLKRALSFFLSFPVSFYAEAPTPGCMKSRGFWKTNIEKLNLSYSICSFSESSVDYVIIAGCLLVKVSPHRVSCLGY